MKILYVDDDRTSHKQAKKYLEQEQKRFFITPVSSVKKGVREFEKKDYDAIVSKYDMGTDDGLAFLNAIRKHDTSTPFIFFTRKQIENEATRALNHGANRYLPKVENKETQYKLLEQAILQEVRHRRTETRYSHLFEMLNDAVFILDLDGNFLTVNETTTDRLEYSEEELLTMNIRDILPSRYEERVDTRINKIKKEQKLIFESEEVTKTGKPISVEVNAKIIQYQGRKAILNISRDISELKRIKKERVKALRKSNAIMESVPDIIYLTDREGRLIDWNKALVEKTRYSVDDLQDSNVLDFFSPKRRKKLEQGLKEVLETGYATRELRIRTSTGKKAYYAFNATPIRNKEGEITGIAGVGKDITKQKRAENRFRHLFEVGPDPAFILNTNAVFTEVNKVFSEMVGSEREDIIGTSVHEASFLPEKSRKKCIKKFEKRLQGEQVNPFTIKIRNKNGEIRYAEINATPILEDEEIVSEIGIARDITKQKIMQGKINTLHKWAQLINKADSLEKVYTYTLDAMEQTLGFETGGILLKQGDTLQVQESRGKSLPPNQHEFPLDGPGLVTKAVQTGNSILANNAKTHPEYIEVFPEVTSELVVPIITEEETIGVLNAENTKKHGFTQRDKQLMETLASHVAIAIKQLREKKRRKATEEKFASLHYWAQLLNTGKNMDEIFKYTLDAIKGTLGFETAAVLIKKENMLKMKAYRGYNGLKEEYMELPLDGPGLTVKAATSGDTIYAANIKDHPAYLPGAKDITSELAIPIKREEEILGVLNVESKKRNAFTTQERRLVATLASHVGVAIKELREKQKRVSLQRLDRLRDKFIAMAAHEFGNPVTIIKITLEALQSEIYGQLTEKQAEKINTTLENLEHLNRLVEDFRQISKLRTGRIELEKNKHTLATTVEKALEGYKNILDEENITLKKSLPTTITGVYDEERFIQVIQNLIKNGIDFTDDLIRVKARETKEEVAITVHDNGIGIPQEEQDKIFHPFYSLERPHTQKNRRFGGTGLGLHICKQILEAHNGKITVKSTVGKGSSFTIHLPKTR